MELNNKRAELQRAGQEIERPCQRPLRSIKKNLRNEWVVAHLDYNPACAHYAKSLEATLDQN